MVRSQTRGARAARQRSQPGNTLQGVIDAKKQAEEAAAAAASDIPADNPAAEVTPEGDERPDAQIIILRDEQGGMEAVPDEPDARAKARAGAQQRKAIFEHRLAGAKNRAGMLPRLLTAQLAAGATNLMLAKILQEELMPATAKEAAEVAKVTHAIYQQASGQSAGNLNLTPVERETRLNEIDTLSQALAERAKEATANLGGAPAEGEELDPGPNPAGETESTPLEPVGAPPGADVASDDDDDEWEHASPGL